MTGRWVCKRCFADNDETDATCVRCGLTRGAEATDADQAGWAAAQAAAPGQRGGGLARWLRFWWIPAIVIALAVGYFTNARRGDDGGISEAGTLQIADLRVGDCFVFEETVEEFDAVDARPCTWAHEYEIFHITTWTAGGDAYPTDPAWDTFIAEACLPAFEDYVGRSYETSSLGILPFMPVESSWAAGGRGVQCALGDPADSELTESLRGADR